MKMIMENHNLCSLNRSKQRDGIFSITTKLYGLTNKFKDLIIHMLSQDIMETITPSAKNIVG